MRPPALLLAAALAVALPAAAEGPAWLAADIGAPYVVLQEDEQGEAEVATLQFLVMEDRGALLRVVVRATDEDLAALFGAGDYVVTRGTGEVVERAARSFASPGDRLGWWLDPAVLPTANDTVALLGDDFRVRGVEERDGVQVLLLEGRVALTVEEDTHSFEVVRAYRTSDGLLQSAEVREAGGAEGFVPSFRVDLASAGPTEGALPPELATFALLGPASFVAGFAAMLLARRHYRAVAPQRTARFCARCGNALAGTLCDRCGTPAGAA